MFFYGVRGLLSLQHREVRTISNIIALQTGLSAVSVGALPDGPLSSGQDPLLRL